MDITNWTSRKSRWIFALLFLPTFLFSQALSRSEITTFSENKFEEAVSSLRSFLEIPNNGLYPDNIMKNAAWCRNKFETLGFEVKQLDSEGVRHLFAQKQIDPSKKTILFYLQIDGQPVDTAAWNQESPYQPVLKKRNGNDWEVVSWDTKLNDLDLRIFARSASDSKGPAIAFISALEILQKKGVTPDFNLKVVMDFQEELGSRTLPPLVERERELFAADVMLIMDGTRHLSNLPTLTFGARGIATITLKVFGAYRNMHSGQYGNFSPNPVFKLSKLLGAMKDDEGRVLIPGYYDGIELTEADKKNLNAVPEDYDEIKKSLGIAEADQVGDSYQEALQYPSLNVRGLRAAWVGNEVRTLVPNEAIAEIDMRLVPETDGQRMVDLVKGFIKGKGFHVIKNEPTDEERMKYPNIISFNYRIGSKPFRTDMNSPLGDWLGRAMEHQFGDSFVKMRTTGGSQPIAPFITTLDIPAVSIRIPNPDNSIHAPNENLRLGNFLEGIQMCLSILTQPLK